MNGKKGLLLVVVKDGSEDHHIQNLKAYAHDKGCSMKQAEKELEVNMQFTDLRHKTMIEVGHAMEQAYHKGYRDGAEAVSFHQELCRDEKGLIPKEVVLQILKKNDFTYHPDVAMKKSIEDIEQFSSEKQRKFKQGGVKNNDIR